MNVRLKYFLYGFLFGCCFPVFAIVFQLSISDLSFSLENVLQAHCDNKLIYIIDSAPLFLGLFALFGGISKAKSVKLLNEFKLLADNLNESNTFIQKESDYVFTDLINSTNEVKQLIQEMLSSSDNLYQKHTDNKTSASDLYSSTTALDNSVSGLIALNGELKEYNDKTSVEIALFRNMVQELANNYNSVNDISREINTLSINSSIEAHRYGEAGKSFSVIARQIKALSEDIRLLNGNTHKITETVNNQVENVSNYICKQNDKLVYIFEIIATIENEVASSTQNLQSIAGNIEHSIEIQNNQRNRFSNVGREVEQISDEKLKLLKGLQTVIERNSALITRIGSL